MITFKNFKWWIIWAPSYTWMDLFISISRGVAPLIDHAKMGGIDMNWLHFCCWSKFSRDWSTLIFLTRSLVSAVIFIFFRVVPIFILPSFHIDDAYTFLLNWDFHHQEFESRLKVVERLVYSYKVISYNQSVL